MNSIKYKNNDLLLIQAAQMIVDKQLKKEKMLKPAQVGFPIIAMSLTFTMSWWIILIAVVFGWYIGRSQYIFAQNKRRIYQYVIKEVKARNQIDVIQL